MIGSGNIFSKLLLSIDGVFESIKANPKLAYALAAVLLALVLVGLVRGWEWTFQPNSWLSRLFIDVFGVKAYRVGLGILVSLAILSLIFLFFIS